MKFHEEKKLLTSFLLRGSSCDNIFFGSVIIKLSVKITYWLSDS